MTSFLSARRTFRYFEFFFTSMLLLMGFSQFGFQSVKIVTTLVTYFIFMLFSFILPINRPFVQKVSYLAAGIILSILANFLGVNSSLFVFIYLIKSCFLLNPKQVYFTAIITGIFWTIGQLLLDYTKVTGTPNYTLPEGFVNFAPIPLSIFYLSIYFISSAFALLFGFMMIAEHRSRARAETLAQEVESLAATLERTRIARDIHDSLGHTLTNLDMQLQVAIKLRDCDPDKAFQALEHAKLLSSQSIDDVSRVLQTMRESDFDLNKALESFFEQFLQTQPLKIQWELNLPKTPLQTSHHIYCIVKEGLINIQKHAKAQHIYFQGYSTASTIFLDLKDDGVGFNVDQHQFGIGLKGLSERVHLLGGELKIQSSLGGGTHLQVTFPYQESHS